MLAGDREASSRFAAGVVTGPGYVVDLLGVTVISRRSRWPAGVQADREIGLRRDGHHHGVADGGGARRDGDRRAPGERDAVTGAGDDERTACRDADVHLAERDRPRAELIGQADPDRLSPGAGPHDVPDRLVVEPGRGEVIRGRQARRRGRHRARGPGGHPPAGDAMSAAAGRGVRGGNYEGGGQGRRRGDANRQAKEMPDTHSRPFVQAGHLHGAFPRPIRATMPRGPRLRRRPGPARG